MENDLLYKIELLQESAKVMGDKVPGMFANAVGPVGDLVEGLLEVMLDIVNALDELQEVRH